MISLTFLELTVSETYFTSFLDIFFIRDQNLNMSTEICNKLDAIKVRFKDLWTKFLNICHYSTMYQIFLIQIAFLALAE